MDGENFVSKQMVFDGSNFNNWRYRMETFLEGKGYLPFVKSTLNELLLLQTDEKDKESIKSHEKKCKSLIVNHIHDSQLEYVEDKTGAKDVFDALRAILTANYIKNRCITSAFGEQIDGKTPAELWYGEKPDLSNFRVFGSVCYNHVPTENRGKFDSKTVKCIMLGYNSSTSYRLWDIENKKLIVGRHVVFNERRIFEQLDCVQICDSEAAGDQMNELATNKVDNA